MIDSHAHLHDARYDDDRPAVLARARAAGLATLISVGCDLADSTRALAVAQEYDLHASVGIHPHESATAPADIGAAFAPFFADPHIVAVGEIGLDYYYDHAPRDVQQRVFRAQLALARERKLPVIFHQRDAFDDFLEILREEFTAEMRGVIHCFTGDATQARTYVDEFGLSLGIGGVLTFKSAHGLREAVQHVGLAPLILETDCPYLAPVPLRGQRNEPAFMAHVVDRLAELLAQPRATIIAATTQLTQTLFALP